MSAGSPTRGECKGVVDSTLHMDNAWVPGFKVKKYFFRQMLSSLFEHDYLHFERKAARIQDQCINWIQEQ